MNSANHHQTMNKVIGSDLMVSLWIEVLEFDEISCVSMQSWGIKKRKIFTVMKNG